MFPEVVEIMQKSYKQDPASQRRKELMLKCFQWIFDIICFERYFYYRQA